ncbi:MarR family winged helix-turn-helix transcriptional regulator [Actinokineospora bangkokensis]|uniref:MarR family transcriptional regulator n=1 Tax=Actinokineospora bangkokensis TaxID=1193682 RepID=A0A1Q9LQK2_9PSEU|nr:MarR family transcriptional regulator [Actinokineospora bangkokensis]OLR94305.1 MarR family transcriptional regulator [Actinokineospora bangkokensis]
MTDRAPGLLEQQLCFALYSASRAMTTCYRPLLDEVGLTYPQYIVLLALFDRGPLSVKDLGETLRLDSGTLSPLLKRMEAGGVVRRERSQEDERSVVVSLTDQGEALRSGVQRMPAAIVEATGSTVEQIVDLQAQVTAFLTRLEAARDQPSARSRAS